MNDNLAKMVEGVGDGQADITLPEEEPKEEQDVQVEETQVEPEEVFDINITNLSSWFETYQQSFGDEIRNVNAKGIKGIDPEEDLIMTVPHPDGGETAEGIPKRKLRTFDKANTIPVLDIEGIAMNVFNNNTFRIVYATEHENVFIKYYGAAARQVVFCVAINELLIPYAIHKVKKNDKGINVIDCPENIGEKLSQPVNIEDIIIRYKQIEKFQNDITTNEDAINFFMGKITTVVDVNHLLQIDQVMINMLA